MKLIGEIYLIPCPNCGKDSKVTVHPDPMHLPFMSEEEVALMEKLPYDSYPCWNCRREVVIPHRIICIGYQSWNQYVKNELFIMGQRLTKISDLVETEKYEY